MYLRTDDGMISTSSSAGSVSGHLPLAQKSRERRLADDAGGPLTSPPLPAQPTDTPASARTGHVPPPCPDNCDLWDCRGAFCSRVEDRQSQRPVMAIYRHARLGPGSSGLSERAEGLRPPQPRPLGPYKGHQSGMPQTGGPGLKPVVLVRLRRLRPVAAGSPPGHGNGVDDLKTIRQLADVLAVMLIADDRLFKIIRSSREGQKRRSWNALKLRPLALAYSRTLSAYRSPLVSRRTVDTARSRSPAGRSQDQGNCRRRQSP